MKSEKYNREYKISNTAKNRTQFEYSRVKKNGSMCASCTNVDSLITLNILNKKNGKTVNFTFVLEFKKFLPNWTDQILRTLIHLAEHNKKSCKFFFSLTQLNWHPQWTRPSVENVSTISDIN